MNLVPVLARALWLEQDFELVDGRIKQDDHSVLYALVASTTSGHWLETSDNMDSNREDSGHSDEDSTDERSQDVVDAAAVVVAETGVQAEVLGGDEVSHDSETERFDE